MAARRRDVAPGARVLLAVESSGRTPSAALLRGEEVVAEEQGTPGRTGAESLLPCVDAVLRRAGVSVDGIEAFAVSIGPGSFTGLRVGVSTVKGLAFGGRTPVAPVPTLAALARGAGVQDDVVVALLDARRDEFYAAAFRLEGDGRQPLALEPREGVYTLDELAARLPAECRLAGDGVPLCGDRLRGLAGAGVHLGPADDPHARDVGALGQRVLAARGGVGADELVPRYLRRAQAEAKRTGERFE